MDNISSSQRLFFVEDRLLLNANEEIRHICNALEHFSNIKQQQIYVLISPLLSREEYAYTNCYAVVAPGYKLILAESLESDPTEDELRSFGYYCEDFLEDIGNLSERYDYRSKIGRPRAWKSQVVHKCENSNASSIVNELETAAFLQNPKERRLSRLIASLAIGSINDMNSISLDVPEDILEQIKQKIILFDTQQSRFIYQKVDHKRISIQGLAGTGKTELLLHKLRHVYVDHSKGDNRVFFTCYNKVLAHSMKKRVVNFFNFMKVEEQIDYDRLHVAPSWGAERDPSSGFYSYVCNYYGINFNRYSATMDFDRACKTAIEELGDNPTPCLDYTFIDESQDFPDSFFELCTLVTKNSVYIAGDIFQDIYDMGKEGTLEADYVLSNCYRTDPRTLLFSHALGLGLCENPIIGWLTEDNWKMCGYTLVRKENHTVQVSRQPLNRFGIEPTDNFGTPPISLQYAESIDGIAYMVVQVIDEIKAAHPMAMPDDIAIVFPGNTNTNYLIADKISLLIKQQYNWNSTKGYETKQIDSESVFISNLNNIKGLEFPFIISFILGDLTRNIRLRNALYMILTRSFVSSYLIANQKESENLRQYDSAIMQLQQHSYLSIREPSDEEISSQSEHFRKIIQDIDTPHKSLEMLIRERVALKNLPEETALTLCANLPQLLVQGDSYSFEDEQIAIKRIDDMIDIVSGAKYYD